MESTIIALTIETATAKTWEFEINRISSKEYLNHVKGNFDHIKK